MSQKKTRKDVNQITKLIQDGLIQRNLLQIEQEFVSLCQDVLMGGVEKRKKVQRKKGQSRRR